MTASSPITRTITATAIAGALLMLSASEVRAQWSVTPYVWTAGLDARVSLDGARVIDEHVAFKDLLQDVDLAAMLRVEGQFGRVGTMLDLFYIGLSSAGESVQLPNGAPGSLDTETGMLVLDATASYGWRNGLALVAGTRVLVERTELDLTIPTSPSSTITQSASESDWKPNAILGLQFRRRLASRLSMDARADIGTGSTKLTWSAGSQMLYALGASERFALSAGYRRLTIEYREDGRIQTDLTMSGFVTGFRVAF